jgi:hypothetical protein
MSVPESSAGDAHPEVVADLFFGTAELIRRLELLLEQIRLARHN